MSTFNVFVGNHRYSVRNWGISDIRGVVLEQPTTERPELYKLTVTTHASSSHAFLFESQQIAEKAYNDITTAQQTGEPVELQLKHDYNRHLLPPDLQ